MFERHHVFRENCASVGCPVREQEKRLRPDWKRLRNLDFTPTPGNQEPDDFVKKLGTLVAGGENEKEWGEAGGKKTDVIWRLFQKSKEVFPFLLLQQPAQCLRCGKRRQC